MWQVKQWWLNGVQRKCNESALCPCGLEAKITSHVLQSCPLHKRERESTWPTDGSLGNKLHGTATNLRLTVRFIDSKYNKFTLNAEEESMYIQCICMWLTLFDCMKCVATPDFCTSRPLSRNPVSARYIPNLPPNLGRKYPPPTSGNKPLKRKKSRFKKIITLEQLNSFRCIKLAQNDDFTLRFIVTKQPYLAHTCYQDNLL